MDLANWMGCLPYKALVKPIIHLAIPGTHNSFSYTINPDSEISPDAPAILKCNKCIQRLLKPFAYNWSVTQMDNVTEQLYHGIRYFDIRLVRHCNDFYVAHSLYGSPVMALLSKLNDFLNKHQSEVVILDFQHFYEFTKVDHIILIQQLNILFNTKICQSVVPIKHLTLSSLISKNYQVLIVYRHMLACTNPSLWPSYCLPNPWPNVIQIDKLLNCLNQGLSHRNLDVGYVSQCIVTVNEKYCVTHVNGNLKRLSEKVSKKIVPWVQEQKRGLNIVMADFVSYKNNYLAKSVIQMNYIS